VILGFRHDVSDILSSSGGFTGVSGQPIGTHFRDQEILELLTLEERRSQGEVEFHEEQNDRRVF